MTYDTTPAQDYPKGAEALLIALQTQNIKIAHARTSI